jgi:hypothetical protein
MSSPIAATRLVPGAAALLARFARQLQGEGQVVRGLIQRPSGRNLIDLSSGHPYPIMQNLGSGSKSCRVDPRGVAEASAVLREAVALGADLVVVNRFGKLEVHGGGLAAEMLTVMVAGIPLLTAVDESNLVRWLDFTGGAGTLLAPDMAALRLWWDGLSDDHQVFA